MDEAATDPDSEDVKKAHVEFCASSSNFHELELGS